MVSYFKRSVTQKLYLLSAVQEGAMPGCVRYGNHMRVLIVGGGIAGLTLGGLLRQRGFRPDIVEKTADYGGVGYVLGLWSSGSSILKGLGLFEAFANTSQQLARYTIADEIGNRLQSFDFTAITESYGAVHLVRRADFIDLLRKGVRDVPVRTGTTVEALSQDKDEVNVTFSDGREATYDIVVGADGIHSRVRALLFGDIPLFYSGMKGWGFWAEPGYAIPGEVIEFWGRGRFFGVYPAKDALCCFVFMAAPAGLADPVDGRIERIRAAFKDFGGVVQAILKDLHEPEKIWHDDLHDIKLLEWYRGRVLLIGDAAAAFLPTAGVGASMAMESAAVLADELTRTDSHYLQNALAHFVKRRRTRVDRVHKQSRMLSTVALTNSRSLAAIRNAALRIYAEKQLLAYWNHLLEGHL
jgi:2-polyprenyl-6-methoxyphenol hydroxylase-like FAD-dependent oxidoreductase